MGRANAKSGRSVVLERVIRAHFAAMLEWMRFADEQIMANTPLVVIETLRYSMKHPKRRALHEFMLEVLDAKQLRHILKLMSTSHSVIQYNAMLLCSNVIDFDPKTARMCAAMGATALLEAYKRQKIVG